jgi:hypothetical protein
MLPGSTGIIHDGQEVAGTSFASPRLALEQALYLLSITTPQQGVECQGSKGILASPPLGYVPEAGDWESPGLTTDLTLDDARTQYCD